MGERVTLTEQVASAWVTAGLHTAAPPSSQVLRQYYCRQRIPQNGKYNYRIVRDMYDQLAKSVCPDMYNTLFAFNPLQVSGAYET